MTKKIVVARSLVLTDKNTSFHITNTHNKTHKIIIYRKKLTGPADDIDEKDNENYKDSNLLDNGLDQKNKTGNESNDNKHYSSKSEVMLKRSTFNKLLVVGITSLLISAFLGGYTLKTIVNPQIIVIPSSSQDTVKLQQGSQLGQNNQMLFPNMEDNKPPVPQPMFPAMRNNPIPSIDDDPMRGNKDASIVLIEFSDYQCPFCKRFFDETMPEIKKNYIDTGKIKHVFRDYPLPIHNNAFPAALAAQCAQDQQKYWQYHDLLFENQQDWQDQNANNTILTFKGYAQDLGMNTVMFDQCLDSKKYQDEVNRDLMHGSVYGISGTPTFYIGNEVKGFTQLVGAQPFPSFDNLLRYYESEG